MKAIKLDLMHRIVSIAQYVLVAILLALVIFQVIVEQQYHTGNTVCHLCYQLWAMDIILALLTRAFFSWYRLSNKIVSWF